MDAMSHWQKQPFDFGGDTNQDLQGSGIFNGIYSTAG